jgi:hypothetical protein
LYFCVFNNLSDDEAHRSGDLDEVDVSDGSLFRSIALFVLVMAVAFVAVKKFL